MTEATRHIDQTAQVKALADPTRLIILRRLMREAATLTQLGAVLGHHPAWVRHHVVQLQKAGLVELAHTRQTKSYVEKFYRATADAFVVNFFIVPEPGPHGLVVIIGSHDMALELLAREMCASPATPDILTLNIGSLEGLIALRQGLGQLAGCHLLDPETGEYNVPYARRLFPGQPLALATLAYREQGLLLGTKLAFEVRDIAAAVTRRARFVNRNAGSGTRIWFDRALAQAGIPPEAVLGYEDEVRTHSEAADRVARGDADVCVGIRAAALRYGLRFVPLFQERYDLVLPRTALSDKPVAAVLERLNDRELRRSITRLGGYDTAHTGEVIELVS